MRKEQYTSSDGCNYGCSISYRHSLYIYTELPFTDEAGRHDLSDIKCTSSHLFSFLGTADKVVQVTVASLGGCCQSRSPLTDRTRSRLSPLPVAVWRLGPTPGRCGVTGLTASLHPSLQDIGVLPSFCPLSLGSLTHFRLALPSKI